MKIAVIMGGTSHEREISLKSGTAVVAALEAAGRTVIPVVLETNDLSVLPKDIDVVFLALHGGYGENGGVQAALDERGIPYTGPGACASRIAMDKIETKKRLIAAGLPTAAFECLQAPATTTQLPLPLVVKPPRDGSSVGISKVTEWTQWEKAIAVARAADPQGEVLVEAYIPGREWTVGIVGETALPVVEIAAPNSWYGYTEKYTPGQTRYLFPEDAEDQPIIQRCQTLALAAFKTIGCRGMSRVDFRVTPEGEPFILEINTIPGFTATSLLPKAAARAGYSFSDLCLKILDYATHD